ncbi:MAG: hypothetical protein FJ216_07840 [Ignavibacteria bacterium]|nr:hypothetical protein [Ignavibacteria bacterium]
MAKVQTFAEKAAKLARRADKIVTCPDTGKETRILDIKMIKSEKTPKGSYKFTEKNMRVYESTFKPIKG